MQVIHQNSDGSTAAVRRQYCGSTAAVRRQYRGSTAAVLRQCHGSIETTLLSEFLFNFSMYFFIVSHKTFNLNTIEDEINYRGSTAAVPWPYTIQVFSQN